MRASPIKRHVEIGKEYQHNDGSAGRADPKTLRLSNTSRFESKEQEEQVKKTGDRKIISLVQ